MKKLAWLILAAAPAATLAGQDQTTDAAVNRSKMMIAARQLPSPQEVRVYDFVNYHRHTELPEPSADGRVSFDARLLRPDLPAGRDAKAALQLGIATWRPKIEDVAPVNLSVVIDVSGSMSGEDRLEYVKQGLEIMVGFLDEDDIVSVVAFSNEARVVRAAAPVARRDALVALIRALQPEHSTNVHAGLMLGYQEVEKNLKAGKHNKVILLSDGETNVGIVDPEKIVAESKAWNDRGVGLTTIGVGLQYNDKLMSGLAAAAKGTYHFLDSAQGIERTFIQELVSLLGKIATDPVVTLRLAEGVYLYQVYGYAFEERDDRTVIFSNLLDLPMQLTQVIPVELVVTAGYDPSKGALAEAELSYKDAREGKAVTLKAAATAARRADGQGEGPSDPALVKNFTIARLAQGFLEACRVAHDPTTSHYRRNERARDALSEVLKRVEFAAGGADKVTDADLKRMLDLVQGALQAVQ